MYIQRTIENKIKGVLNRKEIIAVVGARQVGKTTTIHHILDSLLNKKINKLSFDDITTKSLFEEDIESFIELHVKNYDILFIDEIQYVKESGKILKFIYDTQKIKIIVSGSSATELSIQSIKHLVGRVFIFTLYPFSFEEYLRAEKPDLLDVYMLGNYKQTITKELNKHKQSFILYGGYPAVVLEKDTRIKEEILRNIYNTHLLREIRDLLHLAENDKLVKLLKILVLQTGNIINYTDLSQETGFSQPTLKKYLTILEQTFICQRVKPFFTNKKKELVKNPKIYFIDFGFRNACLNNFSTQRTDVGMVQEQFVFTEFLKKDMQLKFWQTKSKAEVDFIIEKNNKQYPLEIKTMLTKAKTTRSFMNFLQEYKPEKSFILSDELETIITKQKQQIRFKPVVKINKLIEELNA